mgnify:CR=1 FL=1
MPQEESKRGAHFAKGSAPQAPAPEATSFDNEIRNAWSAAADPGETAVYRRSIERQREADRLRGSSCAASR